MNKSVLEEINSNRKANKSFVLVTDMQNGQQNLIYPEQSATDYNYDPETMEQIHNSLANDRCTVFENNAQQLLVQPYNPPLCAIIIGAVHISQELVPLLQRCQYQVVVIDPRESFANQERFPDIKLVTEWPDQCLPDINIDARTAVITLTHDPKFDDPALIQALKSDAFYIGALGSRKTQEARQLRLQSEGFDAQQLSRINGPVGLDINARSPAEIAISIMAEITQILRS
jgi:xanthine dehydrogenase accessory factor